VHLIVTPVIAIEQGQHPLFDAVLPDRLGEIGLRKAIAIDMEVAPVEFVSNEVQISSIGLALVPDGALRGLLVSEGILEHHLRLGRRERERAFEAASGVAHGFNEDLSFSLNPSKGLHLHGKCGRHFGPAEAVSWPSCA